MSEIGSRKISEWVNECKRRNGNCYTESRCDFTYLCSQHVTEPQKLVPDPPRFNEQQMALLRGFHSAGIREVYLSYNGAYKMYNDHKDEVKFSSIIDMKPGQTLDLAELLGKDDAEC